MALQFNINVQGISSKNIPDGNIRIKLTNKFQTRYSLPHNGQQIILDDFIGSEYCFPLIQFPPSALTTPMYLFRALGALNLDLELCTLLHKNISNPALRLFSGGLKGFYLFADVEVVQIDQVEGIDGVEGADGTEGDDVVKDNDKADEEEEAENDDDDEEEEENEEEEEEEEVVEEEIDGDDDDDNGEVDEERLLRMEESRIIVEMLSRKQNREVRAGEMCVVCLEELEEREIEVTVMPCDHIFHASCISRWLEDNNSCPLCRREIKYEDLVSYF